MNDDANRDDRDDIESETADQEASGDDAGSPRESTQRAKDELFEAIDHFRSAASLMFDRATHDPAVRNATAEAERVIRKVGETAEPLARQLTSELSRLTRRVSESVQQSLEGRRGDRSHRDDVVPPREPDDDR